MTLKDKIVIVTGGSGLIGRAIISDILKRGGFVINIDLDVKTDLNSGTFNADVSNDSAIQDAVRKIVSEFGKIDGLVNNAYARTIDWGNKFEDILPDSWRKNVDLQLNSHFVISQIVLKQMKIQHYGSIVNIASIYGVVGNDFTVYEGTELTSPAAYSAIKGGLINLTRYLASYYGKENVRINCVSPGGIFDNQHPTFIKNYENRVPLKRMGRPEDIAPAVSFLLSQDSKYITGQNIIVDGGWTCI
jgi:NAD(P)-dependent dehydrogenase (short-subunit alcohol dehydrogenase family)